VHIVCAADCGVDRYGERGLDRDPVARPAQAAHVNRHVERELDVRLFGLQSADTALIDALEEVAQRSGRLFVVTLGPAGALALGRGARISCAPRRRRADRRHDRHRDAFTAGLLCEYARSRDVARSLSRGSEVASASLGHLGSFELP
jgi:sugar/nucleoside kinase (ribokinase family)